MNPPLYVVNEYGENRALLLRRNSKGLYSQVATFWNPSEAVAVAELANKAAKDGE